MYQYCQAMMDNEALTLTQDTVTHLADLSTDIVQLACQGELARCLNEVNVYAR